MITAADLGKRIKEARTSAGLNLRELGAQIGTSDANVCRYEAGKTEVSALTLSQIADAVGRASSWFYGDHGSVFAGLTEDESEDLRCIVEATRKMILRRRERNDGTNGTGSGMGQQ